MPVAGDGAYRLLGFDVGTQARGCGGKVSLRGTVTTPANLVLGLRGSGVGQAARPGADLAKGTLVLDHPVNGTTKYTFTHIEVGETQATLFHVENNVTLQFLQVLEGTPPLVGFIDELNPANSFVPTALDGTVKITTLAACQ